MLLSIEYILLWALISITVGSFMILIIRRKYAQGAVAKALALASAAVAVALLIVRMLESGGLAFASGMDFGFWLCAVSLLALVWMTFRMDLAMAGTVIYPGVALLGVWMLTLSMASQPAMPALRSFWLDFHVSAAIVAYTAFFAAFAMSLLLAVRLRGKASRLPDADTLSDWIYRANLIGMPFQTIMLVTGAVWAEYAWGSFWSWDPKETWALITWFIYAIYLHLRLNGASERALILVNGIGFAAILFTFFGVSYLLPGMHSYL